MMTGFHDYYNNKPFQQTNWCGYDQKQMLPFKTKPFSFKLLRTLKLHNYPWFLSLCLSEWQFRVSAQKGCDQKSAKCSLRTFPLFISTLTIFLLAEQLCACVFIDDLSNFSSYFRKSKPLTNQHARIPCILQKGKEKGYFFSKLSQAFFYDKKQPLVQQNVINLALDEKIHK